jgi:hypothetical protein
MRGTDLISLNFAILILSAIGLFLLAGICFATYRIHRIPQFLLLGLAIFPFGIISVVFSESDEAVFVEISVFATVVTSFFIISFALSLLYPKFLEHHYLLPYLALSHLAGLLAAVITHEISVTAAAWMFGFPSTLLILVILARATWKAYELGAMQLALFCSILLVALVLGGTISLFYRGLGLGIAAYAALFGLIAMRSLHQPESMALLYREYLLLSGSRADSEILSPEDLSIGVLIFGPKGPEFFLQLGELFNALNSKKNEISLKLAHFYFAMFKPLLEGSTSLHDTFGPMPAFNFPGIQSLVGAGLLSSKDLGDPRLQDQIITLIVLYYPARFESLELVRSLRYALFEYFQGKTMLEEISEHSLESFQQKIIRQLSGDLMSSLD